MRRLLLEMRRSLAAPSRNPRMATVLGRLLGSAFVICFLTGLYSHFLQQPEPWMHFATRPFFLYQLTQGIHITAGIACFPLLLGKLYSVFPNLFQTPPIRGFLHFLERASITLFVSTALIEITIGLLDTFQWYPFPFYFKQVHYALSFILIGSLAIHIATKLPVIRRYWFKKRSFDENGELLLDPEDRPVTSEQIVDEIGPRPEPTAPIARRVSGVTGRIFDWIDSAPPPKPAISRRGFVATIGVATATLVALTGGQSFAFLNGVNVFAPRKQGIGPDSLPVNRSAKAAQVLTTAMDPDWTLTVARQGTTMEFTYADLKAFPQHVEQLPIACVEGWSQMATWRGVRLSDLMATVGRRDSEGLRLTSLEKSGAYRRTNMGAEYVQDDRTLVALEVNGQTLDIEHGYPARMIAPGRPGVLQTKWLSRIEVL
ncbi:molybdopterin-dependent oxidoreductase [Leifsonia aquatica]|uniref:molybdopterin-dependent oxidoreductase n=1 Tax=Leifsonia aquatica TaxID=144185 RepID=UPI0037FC08D0